MQGAWVRSLVRKSVLVTQSCLTLCNSIDGRLPGSSIHGILQARILEWVAIPFSRDLPDPGIEPGSPALAGRFFTTEPPGKWVSWLGFRAILHVTKAQVLDCFVLFTVIIPEVFFNSSYFLHQIVINQNSLVAGKKKMFIHIAFIENLMFLAMIQQNQITADDIMLWLSLYRCE